MAAEDEKVHGGGRYCTLAPVRGEENETN